MKGHDCLASCVLASRIARVTWGELAWVWLGLPQECCWNQQAEGKGYRKMTWTKSSNQTSDPELPSSYFNKTVQKVRYHEDSRIIFWHWPRIAFFSASWWRCQSPIKDIAQSGQKWDTAVVRCCKISWFITTSPMPSSYGSPTFSHSYATPSVIRGIWRTWWVDEWPSGWFSWGFDSWDLRQMSIIVPVASGIIW